MHGPRPIPRGEHTTKTFDDDLIVPHCLNKTVTQRKWLPQIKCYPNRGGNRVGGGISKMAKQELLATIRDRYQASSRGEGLQHPTLRPDIWLLASKVRRRVPIRLSRNRQ